MKVSVQTRDGKIIQGKLTADHPSSSQGQLVLVVAGKAYQREEAALDELTQLDNIVLATGGGAVMREANRQHLQGRGTVVYLHTSIDQQLERTAKDRNRPLLQTENPRAVLEALITTRDPLYRDCCDLLIKTDRRHPKGVVNDIIRFIKRQQPLQNID